MPFHCRSCSLTFSLLLFSLSLLSFYGFVLWGWGVRTDRVSIALPGLHYQPFLIMIIIAYSTSVSQDYGVREGRSKRLTAAPTICDDRKIILLDIAQLYATQFIQEIAAAEASTAIFKSPWQRDTHTPIEVILFQLFKLIVIRRSIHIY